MLHRPPVFSYFWVRKSKRYCRAKTNRQELTHSLTPLISTRESTLINRHKTVSGLLASHNLISLYPFVLSWSKTTLLHYLLYQSASQISHFRPRGFCSLHVKFLQGHLRYFRQQHFRSRLKNWRSERHKQR